MIPHNIPDPKVKILVALPPVWSPEDAARLQRPTFKVDEQEFRRARLEVNHALYLWKKQSRQLTL